MKVLLIFTICFVFAIRSQKRPICELPIKPGPCSASIPRYAFSPKEGKCVEFTFGGCHGNFNNFVTEKTCVETCVGKP
ncbi:hypothetical protein RB195_020840 [Necator americanus]|uniref:Uncharacterized protein n=2 Tax=Necator americanus TaxID=51031 RepID=A0ABR1CKS4_NECAM|nr:Kunitz/Bovine pancreatic trypsin inhibitor domain protein [Necator americanus]ETN72485.1 Kunitz/Bovine pancreatic trypsin inhibitor domain protein [Necator americanus]